MNVHRSVRPVAALAVTFALLASAPPPSVGAEPAAPGLSTARATTSATTSAGEARRVDRVPTPRPDWFDCTDLFGTQSDCASVRLPLDYDKPRGAQTEVAVLRIKATDQKRKLGTLFLNPGGPGGSGVDFASFAPYFLSPSILARFDIVGFDPRGTNYSDNVRCWRNAGEQSAAVSGMNVAFPWTRREERAFVTSSKAFGRACSTAGRPLTAHMSTAEVARDMDVLRRAMGDRLLTYLGFSYGSYLGNVYANLFPDRVRAVAIDGVLDPIAWSGGPGSTRVPQTTRLRSAEGAARALDEILRRCRAAGPAYCALAAAGNPQRSYQKIVSSLKRKPLDIADPDTGEVYFVLDYATLIAFMLGDLYSPDGASAVDADLTFVLSLLGSPPGASGERAAQREEARTALVAKYERLRQARRDQRSQTARRRAALGYAFPYYNYREASQTVLCTDGLNPENAGRWPAYADRADSTAPGFGRLWTWISAPCASRTWKVRDRDAYPGPFSRRTARPVLVVGNYWDPATNYAGAVTAASLLPNSRLLSSDSWGHTAYGTSACVTGAVDRYLRSGRLPRAGATCRGDLQPFTEPLESSGQPRERSLAPPRRLPPVVPPVPGALPRS